jgi:hypothetical protein
MDNLADKIIADLGIDLNDPGDCEAIMGDYNIDETIRGLEMVMVLIDNKSPEYVHFKKVYTVLEDLHARLHNGMHG